MKRAVTLALSLICVLLLAVFAAGCTGTALDSGYSDVVEEFYGDGLSVTAQYAAPSDATEFRDRKRVDKKIVVDNRISGSHITGLYLPAGESIKVTIPASTLTYSSSVSIISNDGSMVLKQPLNKVENIVTCGDKGGIILFNIGMQSVDDQLNPFEITIEGAIPAPYYRYGLDSTDVLSGCEECGKILAVIDSGNMRFYVPSEYIRDIDGLKEALEWWRSVCGYIGYSTSSNRMDGNSQPVKIYATENGNEETDLYLTKDESAGIFDATALAESEAGLDIMVETGVLFARRQGFSEEQSRIFGSIAAYNSYMLHKDSFVIFDEADETLREKIYFSNSKNVLDLLMSGSAGSPLTYAIMCMSHSFGTEKTREFIDAFTTNASSVTADTLLLNAAAVFGVDASSFLTSYAGVTFSSAALQSVSDRPDYIPIFNYYTRSVKDDNEQNGKKIYIGNTELVDFAATTTVCNGTVKSVSVEGSNGWSKGEEGYYYSALSENVRDGYKLTIVADVEGREVTYVSYGEISLNVNAAAYSLYRNADYGSLDEAVDSIKGKAPDYKSSLGQALCGDPAYIGEEIDDKEYTLSVTEFNFEVPEDGIYEFSLVNTNTSFCYYRVDFGVGDYEYTMFDNYVPTQTIGTLLQKEELKKGYVYRFRMYLLQPSVNNGVMLYVSRDGEGFVPVNDKYMSYPDTTKDSQMEYVPPVQSLQGLAYPDTIYMKESHEGWQASLYGNVIKTAGELTAMFDGKTGATSLCTVSVNGDGGVEISLDEEKHLDYIRLYATALNGVIYNFEVFDGTEWSVVENIDNQRTSVVALVNGSYSHIRIRFTGSGTVYLKEVEAGSTIDNCTYVPHTSNKIWYEGHWMRKVGGIGVNGSITQVSSKNSYAEFSFYGDEIAVMATKSPDYGRAIVYIDGRKADEISLYSKDTVYQTVVFYAKLDEVGNHTIRVANVDEERINIDALAYSEGVYNPDNTSMPFNPYYLFAIPAIIGIGLAICIILDLRAKNKGKRKTKNKAQEIADVQQEGEEAVSLDTGKDNE